MKLQELGVAIGRGIIKQVADYALIYLVLILVYSFLRGYFAWGVDSTDESGWKRSGLRIHTDRATGIEYLSDGKGGLIVRGKAADKI